MSSTLTDLINPCLLIGDIGGTHARLALVQGPLMLKQKVYATQEFNHLSEVLHQFKQLLEDDSHDYPQAQAACFAVAGPVLHGEVLLTNVGWKLTENHLSELLNIKVRLVNDFYAQAVAIPHLTRDSLVHLCGPELQDEGEARPIAVLGAGTGLGEALLIPEPQPMMLVEEEEEQEVSTHVVRSIHYQAIATEGSHARFAPRNEREIGLLRWLQGRYGDHISVERVVSGQGLVDLFSYLQAGRSLPKDWTYPVNAAQVSQAALDEEDEVCQLALQHFVEVYADEAANLVLKSNAEAVYLSGGITQKILPALHSYFHPIFTHKGRYQNWLSKVSVWVVMVQEPGLLGAQIIAEELV